MPYYYSLSHNRITQFYQSERVSDKRKSWMNQHGVITDISSLEAQEHLIKINEEGSKKPLNKKPGQMSRNSKKKIINRVNWLALNSKERNVKLNNGHIIKNFRISIITLTLPAKQKHGSKELVSKGLNQFLTTMRSKFGWKNYVWKAELQENGNLHFHICTDRVMHYKIIRKYWNAILDKLGYITTYQRKFALMSKQYYVNYNISKHGGSRSKWSNAYHYGVSTGWKDPNTTDVKSVTDTSKVAAYVSKYLSKPLAKNGKAAAQNSKRLSELGRFWSCSHSLSKLGNVKLCVDDSTSAVFNFLRKMKNIFVFENDFVECLMFGKLKLPKKLQDWIYGHLIKYADMTGYVFPAGIPVKCDYAYYDSQVKYQEMLTL